MAFFVILNQVFILFLLMSVGFCTYRFGMVDENGVRQFTSVLCYIVSPCVIIYAFQMQYTKSLMTGFLIATASAFGIHFFVAVLSHFFYNKKNVKDTYTRNVARFATVYSNCGFMGFPLLQALAGTTGLFFGSAFCSVFSLFNWSHGIMLYSGKINKGSFFKALVNPNIIAVVIGVLMFRFSVELPSPAYLTIKYISNLNTPLSMIIIGTSISQIRFKTLFLGKLAWIVVLLRNLAIPFALIFALHAIGVSGQLLLCCVIPAACPVAGSTVLFARLVGKDTNFPTKLITLSTLLCIVTVPFVVYSISLLKF